MFPDIDGQIKQAQALVKAGRKAEARRLLEQIVERYDQNETAWLWLSATVDSIDEQRICLENVLLLNPNNAKARKGLEALNSKSGTMRASQVATQPSGDSWTADPPSPPPYTLPPAPSSPSYSNDPFGDYGTSVPRSNPTPHNAPFATNTGVQDTQPAQGSVSSVDWGKGNNNPAYGSGKPDIGPTSAELDSWMAQLPVERPAGSKPPAAPPPRADDAVFMQGSAPPLANSTPAFSGEFGDFGEFDFSGPFGSNSGNSTTGSSAQLRGASSNDLLPDMTESGSFVMSGSSKNKSNPAIPAAPATWDAYSDDAYTNQAYDNQPITQPYAQPGYGQAYDQQYTDDANQYDSQADLNLNAGWNTGGTTARPASTSAERFQFGAGSTNPAANSAQSARRGAEIPNSSALFAVDDLDEINLDASDLDDAGIFGGSGRSKAAGGSGVFGVKTNAGKPAKAEKPANGRAAKPSAKRGKKAADTEFLLHPDYQLIPDEIHPAGLVSRKQWFVVGVLGLLNAVSVAVLIFINLRSSGILR